MRKLEQNSEEGDDAEPSGETETKSEDPEAKILPEDKCIRALAEMRRANWFLAQVPGIESCVECMRVMRDLSHREATWSSLSDWAIELLCEKAISSQNPMQRRYPAKALSRIFEVRTT